jgi:transposase
MVGVEGTGSYGAGLTRFLLDRGINVVEVDRPDRRTRRQRGTSDPIDAEAAARAVLAGVATAPAKRRDGIVESIRALRAARAGAIKRWFHNGRSMQRRSSRCVAAGRANSRSG